MEQAMKDGEGCNIEGWLEVLRVAGNFHVSVHSQVAARTYPQPCQPKPTLRLLALLRSFAAAKQCLGAVSAVFCLATRLILLYRNADVQSCCCSQDFMLLGRAQAELATMRQHQAVSGGALNPMV